LIAAKALVKVAFKSSLSGSRYNCGAVNREAVHEQHKRSVGLRPE
jgi:hypothetical protein